MSIVSGRGMSWNCLCVCVCERERERESGVMEFGDRERFVC